MPDTTRLAAVVSTLLELVPAGLDLVADGGDGLAAAFPPLRVVALPPGPVFTLEHCECDGFYDRIFDPDRPVVYYRTDVAPARRPFTLAHEAAHHLIWGVAPERLLDAVDRLAGPGEDPNDVEERVCNAFAGRLLIPDRLVDAVVGPGPVRPGNVVELVARTGASWRAVAVRLAGCLPGPGAVLLIDEPGTVAFAAPSPGLRRRWPSGSRVDPSGPLARALTTPARAARDVYRHGLSFEEALWCDTEPVGDGRAVAVLSRSPSDGRVNLLDPAEARAREPLVCEHCYGLRAGDWCERCRGRACVECGACGCRRRPKARLCPGCGVLKGPGCWQGGPDLCDDCR